MPKKVAESKATRPSRIVFCTAANIVYWDYDIGFMSDAHILGYPSFRFGSTVYVYGVPAREVRS